MDRLTTISEITGSVILIALKESCGENACDEFCEEFGEKECKGCPIQEAFERLLAYEVIGLAPEQIGIVLKENNEITRLNSNLIIEQQREIDQLKQQLSVCGMKEDYDKYLAAMQENDQLKAQAATMREAWESLGLSFSQPYCVIISPKENRYCSTAWHGAPDAFRDWEYARKAIERVSGIFAENPIDYHNPSDLYILTKEITETRGVPIAGSKPLMIR
jgi:hypothetical protein